MQIEKWDKMVWQMNNSKEDYVQVYCSIQSKVMQIRMLSKMRWQMNNSNYGYVQVYCSVWSKVLQIRNGIEDVMTNKWF